MNALQRSNPIGSEESVFVRNWFTPKPDEPTQSTTPKPESELDEPQEPIHPVWNGELDEPVWW